MYSPFSNYIGPVTAGETESVAFAVEPETISPFQEAGTFLREKDVEREQAVQFEGELSEAEMALAIKLNNEYMKSLGFEQHLRAIESYFNELLYYGMPNFMTPTLFAKSIDKYQELRKLKPTNKGAMGIGTWSMLQGELGLHHLTNNHKINLDRAKLRNSFFEKKIWGSNKEEIFNALVKAGILKFPLPLDAGYFALAIAEFQSKKPGTMVDGVLGPKTIAILIPGGLDPNTASKLSDEQLITRIIEKIKGYTDAYLNGLDSFTVVVSSPSKEEIAVLEAEYKKDFYSEIGKMILDKSIEFLSEEIPFIGAAYKIVITIQDFLEKYRKHREEYDKMVLANQLKDFLVDERNSFANVHTFFESNQSELVDVFSKISKKTPAVRKNVESIYEKLQKIDWTQQAVFQSICEKWMGENNNHGIIQLDLLVNMVVGKTTISCPFGSRMAERLLKNGGGWLDLEKFKVSRTVVYFPYDQSMDSITGFSARLSSVKNPDGRFDLMQNYFPIGSRQDDMNQAIGSFSNYIYSRSLPRVNQIESK